jgi:hypothetical protein
MTYQIIYVSESSMPMQLDALEDLLEEAQAGNAEDGITGALVYVEQRFLQILEGDQDTVLDLMARIRRDVRHESVTILQQRDIPAAVFGGWTMAYVSATNQQVAQWIGLGEITTIPELLTDFQQDADRATRLAQGILSLLAVNTTHAETDRS